MVMLHIKLKGMELRAQCKYIYSPYTHPQMRVGLKCKINSECDRAAYQIKGKEVQTYIEANTLTLHPPLQVEVRKRAKIRNRYNQVPHLTQDTNGKVTSQLDITSESQEVSHFPAGDHKASTNRSE